MKRWLGYVSFTFDYSTWEAAKFLYMYCLFIRLECRSIGIGGEIMTRLNKLAKKMKCANAQWQTPQFNTRAIKFYNRIGAVGKKKVRFTFPLSS